MRSSSPFVSSPGMQPLSSPYSRPIQVPAGVAMAVQHQGLAQSAQYGSGILSGQQTGDGMIYVGTDQYVAAGRPQMLQQNTRTQSPMPSPYLLPSMSPTMPAYPTPSASPQAKPMDHASSFHQDRQSHFSLLSGPANGGQIGQTHSLDLRQKRKGSLTGVAPPGLRIATASLTFSEARNIFQMLDTSGRGAITQSELIRGLRNFGDVASKLGLANEGRQGEEVRRLFGAKFGRMETGEEDFVDQAEFCRFFAGGILPLPLNTPSGRGGQSPGPYQAPVRRRYSQSALVNSPPAPSLLPQEANRSPRGTGTPRRNSLSNRAAPPLLNRAVSAPALNQGALSTHPASIVSTGRQSPEQLNSVNRAPSSQHMHAQQMQQRQEVARAQQQPQRQPSQQQNGYTVYQADEANHRAPEGTEQVMGNQRQGSMRGQESWRGSASLSQQHKELTGLRVQRDKSGMLFAFDGAHEEWKLRMFSLKESMLVYSEFQPMVSMRPVGKPTFIQLYSGTLVEALNKPMFGRPFCFSVRTRQDGDVFLLSAESREERSAWLKILENAGCTCRCGEGDVDNSLRFWLPFLFGEPMF